MATSSIGHMDMAEIYHLLDSTDLSVLEETTALVRDNLGSVQEPWLLHGLVDYFMQSGNIIARNLLCMVRQHQHKILMNKVDDYLQKVNTRFKALCLFGHIVRNEPIWTHLIISTRPFQTVLKCLQVDTDLPTITSALYIMATLLPKVASQVCNYLPTLFSIYVRLVSWHTIKPAGANEANLIHLHTSVYALFLCLYGMFPCSFTRFLQQHFQPHNTTSNKGTSEKERARIFENSVQPMLDQVRLHPRLITDTYDIEVSSQRWRKVGGQDIIADINSISLDPTENSTVKGDQQKVDSSEDVNKQRTASGSDKLLSLQSKRKTSYGDNDAAVPQDSLWSPSVAIGLATPPPSRRMSPPFSSSKLNDSSKFNADMTKAADEVTAQDEIATSRPSTLNMSSSDGFVPNRPHQTASATSTPLKHSLPSLIVSSPSASPRKGKVAKSAEIVDRKDSFVVITSEALSELTADSCIQENNCDVIPATDKESNNPPHHLLPTKSQIPIDDEVDLEDDEAFVDVSCCNVEPDSVAQEGITVFTPGLLPSDDETIKVKKTQSGHGFEMEVYDSAAKVLNLPNTSRYIEKSPNELLDLHIQLLADSYMKYKDRYSIPSNKEMEWRPMIDSSSVTSADAGYLRSQVLQMHCVMLYERHRREQHALRARTLQRKVYDTEALEETNSNLTFNIGELEKDVHGFKMSAKLYREKIIAKEKSWEEKEKEYQAEIKTLNVKIQDFSLENQALQDDYKALKEECQRMRSEEGHIKSKLFASDQLLLTATVNKKQLDELQFKVANLEEELFAARELNCTADDRVREAQAQAAAEISEAKQISDAYARERVQLNERSNLDKQKLDFLTSQVEQLQSEVKRKDGFHLEQKKYLEDVKSLARGQIQAMEAKYTAQRHISQRLEIQVMELYSKVSAMEGEMTLRERTQLGSAPRSIETLSAIQADGQHQHILGSSPQLSPPIRSGLLSDVKQWNQRKMGT